MWSVAALSFLLFASYSIYSGVNLEDAFITYRYARNLAVGNGFTFNPGEHVLGTTAPLHALILAAGAKIFGVSAIPDISVCLMLLCGVAAAVVLCNILYRVTESSIVSFLGPLVFVTNRTVLLTTCGGMETPLVILLMLSSMLSTLKKQWILAGILSVLLVLTRIDGIIWAALLLLYSFRVSWRGAMIQVAVLVGCLLPAAAMAGWYFGSPIPHTVIAKRIVGPTAWLSDSLLSIERVQMWSQWLTTQCNCAPTMLIGFATLFGVVGILRRKSAAALLFVVFPACYIVALYIGRASLDFDWYLTPVILCTSSLIGIGIGELSDCFRWYNLALHRRHMFLIAMAILLLPMSTIIMMDIRWEFFRSRMFQSTLETGLRRPVGEWLRDHTPAGATVAMEAVGYQAYFSERRVIDIAGLVSPEVVRIRRRSGTNAEAFARILKELRPDYLVLRTFEMEQNQHLHGGPLFENEKERLFFLTHYKEVKRFVAPRNYGPLSRITVYGPAAQETVSDAIQNKPSGCYVQ